MKPARLDKLLRDLGRRIAELRVARQLTQEQFAEKLKVSARYVQLVEAGSENLTMATMLAFATALRVEVPELLAPPRSRAPKRPGRPAKRG